MKDIVYIIGVVLLSLLLVSCSSQQTAPVQSALPVQNVIPAQPAQQIEPIQLPEQSTPAGPAAKIVEVNMIAKQFEFDPSVITVNKGDTVIIHVRSIDVAHGFALPEYGISERLPPNQAVDIEFVADKQGTFTFFCNIPCGSGHGAMRGTLIVN